MRSTTDSDTSTLGGNGATEMESVSSSGEASARCLYDPDVTLVIGGKTYQEYSSNLCSWSRYFDAALNGSSKPRWFEFPHRDPAEWEWILALTAPFAKEQITKENLPTALSWLSELDSKPGLERCDDVLCSHIVSVFQMEGHGGNVTLQKDHLDELLNALATSTQHSLQRSGAKCLAILSSFSFDRFISQQLDFDQLERITSFLANVEDSNPSWRRWSADDEQIQKFITAGFFPTFLRMRFEHLRMERELDKQKKEKQKMELTLEQREEENRKLRQTLDVLENEREPDNRTEDKKTEWALERMEEQNRKLRDALEHQQKERAFQGKLADDQNKEIRRLQSCLQEAERKSSEASLVRKLGEENRRLRIDLDEQVEATRIDRGAQLEATVERELYLEYVKKENEDKTKTLDRVVHLVDQHKLDHVSILLRELKRDAHCLAVFKKCADPSLADLLNKRGTF